MRCPSRSTLAAAAAAAAAVAVFAAAPALATVRSTGAKIRWAGEAPSPAEAGRELAGRFEVVAAIPGIVENLKVEGIGWSPRSLDAPARTVLARGARRAFPFRATPGAPAEPLVVSGTFNGQPIRQRFRLDAASLARATRPGPVAFRDGPPRLAPVPKAPRGDGGQTIRFAGRFSYMRGDAVPIELGADNIVVRVMDDDSPDPFDEVIWEGTTDVNGYFDVTVNWDDGIDDPDVYVEIVAGNGLVDVQMDNILENTYSWTTEDQVIDDYTGSFIDFGTMMPGDAGEYGAPHIYSNIVRAGRFAAQYGMTPPRVDLQWPDDDGTYYSRELEEIYLGGDETWVEGTQIHEFGHHLHYHYGNMAHSAYQNGFCDGDGPGHCVWCPENLGDAFKEGWANWFASYVVRSYPSTYGIPAFSRNDGRYTLEDPDKCQQDSLAYPSAITEGYVGALLRDIDDPTNDDHDAGPADCDMDAMGIGADAIMTVFRDDDPADAFGFINAFRLRYPEHDQDLWSTTRNVWTGFGFPVTPPLVTSQPEDCAIARAGETVQIQVQGNGSLLTYQWKKDGEVVTDGGGVSGAQAKTLTLSPASAAMSGTYQCFVSTCDGTYSTASLPSRITIQSAVTARPLVAWGENSSGQVGDGTTEWRRPPTQLTGFADLVRAEGGAAFAVGLRADGSAIAWGHADYGELGNGAYMDQRNSPVPVLGLTDVLQIAAGDRHSLALQRDGTLWGWGYNGYGNLGDGTDAPRPVPVLATEVEGCVQAVACGAHHSLALMADGTVLAWGSNEFGALGRGTAGGWSLQPQPVQGLTGVEAVAASGWLNLALKTDGTVWAWGTNQGGCLGTGVDQGTLPHSAVPVQVQGLPVIRKISAADHTGFAISNAGAAYSWGSNQYGILGRGDSLATHSLAPAPIPGLTLPGQIVTGSGPWAAALRSDGTVWAWGYNYPRILGRAHTSDFLWSPLQVNDVSGVTALGAGWGTVYACGQISGTTDVADGTPLPASLALSAAPNPAIASTRIAFDLPRSGHASLAVYDVAGRRVRSLVDGFREAGRYVETWDGRGAGGGAGLAGVFFARLEVDGAALVERLVRIR
jgi:alpha-tubulin suppressor-like RCC1 family protein